MKRILLVLIALLAVGAFASNNQESATGLNGTFSMGGSTTCEPIMTAAIEAFAEIEPGARLTYEANGSSTGIKALAKGTYLLSGSSRKVKDSEIEQGLVPTEVAKDGVALVVSSDVTVDNISLVDLAKIYAGEITNWSDVGGADLVINVINRDEASGTFDAFKSMVMTPYQGKKKEKFIEDAIVVSSNGDMVTKVSTTPGSIAYSGFGYLDQARNGGAKTLNVDNIEPTVANVMSGDYSLARSLFVVTDGQPEEGTFQKIFIDFILSEEGQGLVEEAQYIPLN